MTTSQHSAGVHHKYQAVRSYLAQLIATELGVGDIVPSERVLTERFAVSRMTVRQAVDTLVTDGLVVRVQGRGTFVAPTRIDVEMRLTTFDEEARRRGWTPTVENLEACTLPADPTTAEALCLDAGTEVHHLVRLHSADGEPLCLERAWLARTALPHLVDAGPPENLYEALRAHGLAPTWGEDTIRADEATATEARLLRMDTSTVMRTERRTYAGDTPVALSRSAFRGDRYSVVVPLREPKPLIVPRTASPEPPERTSR